eukprot:10760471-Ditylum_brightwellii.AAC.1
MQLIYECIYSTANADWIGIADIIMCDIASVCIITGCDATEVLNPNGLDSICLNTPSQSSWVVEFSDISY